jgi:threonine dehydrogenase-like Zn-dependent dehydrogenase
VPITRSSSGRTRARVRGSNGHGADVIVEVSARFAHADRQSLYYAAFGARIVLAGVKGFSGAGLRSDLIVVGAAPAGRAFGVVAVVHGGDPPDRVGPRPLDRMHTTSRSATPRAIELLAGGSPASRASTRASFPASADVRLLIDYSSLLYRAITRCRTRCRRAGCTAS